jgi:hypothetical protein
MVNSPYSALPAKAFWKLGVSRQDWALPSDIYTPKVKIGPDDAVMTAGSCFAQHIARHLRLRGTNVIDAEPAPRRFEPDVAQRFGYGLYSARYGNIYTVRQLLQLVQEVTTRSPSPAIAWAKGDRFVDALRPSVEPEGLSSPEEVELHRAAHRRAVRRALTTCDVFVFTLGLTEGWVDRETGTVFPTAPGTIAGDYDPDRYAFKNFTYDEIYKDFVAFKRLMSRVNPSARFLITVSPVPLTATASQAHVLPATVYSKSVLRAVAGQLQESFEDLDYFPSYEIISTPFLRRTFFDDTLRAVTPEGVETVMRIFFESYEGDAPVATAPSAPVSVEEQDEDVVCEDVLLDAFAPTAA